MKKYTTFVLMLWLLIGAVAQGQQVDFLSPVKIHKFSKPITMLRSSDMDGDQVPDLIVICLDTLYILKGAGNGSFTPYWKRVITGYGDLQFCDLNQDSHLDMVYTSGGDLGIIISDGAGGYLPNKTYHLGGTSGSLAIADFNLDGYNDVVAPTNHELDPNYQYVAVFINNKDATLKERVLYAVPPKVYGAPASIDGLYINTLDMNDDNYPDIVQPYFVKDSLAIYYNRGDGTFNIPVSVTVPHSVGFTHVVDMDHDGKQDLVAFGQDERTVLSVFSFGFYLQKTSAHENKLINQTFYNQPSFYNHFHTDINKDGEYDITLCQQYVGPAPDYKVNDSLTIYLNKGGITFDLLHPSFSMSLVMQEAVISDFNSDNLPDYIYHTEDSSLYRILQKKIISGITSAVVNESISIYPNPSSGELTISSEAGNEVKQLALYDAMGKLVLNEINNALEKDWHLNVVSLSKGLYLIKADDIKGKRTTKLLVLE